MSVAGLTHSPTHTHHATRTTTPHAPSHTARTPKDVSQPLPHAGSGLPRPNKVARFAICSMFTAPAIFKVSRYFSKVWAGLILAFEDCFGTSSRVKVVSASASAPAISCVLLYASRAFSLASGPVYFLSLVSVP